MDAYIHAWLNECMNDWLNEGMNDCIHEWLNERKNEWMSERTNEWTNGWMNACMHEWLNGQMNEKQELLEKNKMSHFKLRDWWKSRLDWPLIFVPEPSKLGWPCPVNAKI